MAEGTCIMCTAPSAEDVCDSCEGFTMTFHSGNSPRRWVELVREVVRREAREVMESHEREHHNWRE